MMFKRSGWCVVLAAVSPAFSQWESGSDGSDGAFSPAVSTQVDLSLAASLCDCDGDTQVDDPCRWDCPSPVAGRGVYDAEQWVVVFKYTTVDVPSGATITFGMHPSGAPVVWLATGNVTISGVVNLDGEDGLGPNLPVIPYFGRPGPGGFQSGQSANAGGGSGQSFGLGPGSSPTGAVQTNGWPSYANAPISGCGTNGTGSTYGNSESQPLIGGSGGGASDNTTFGQSGGAGGGAILIGSTTQITVGGSGAVRAEGGDSGPVNCSGGSGVWGGAPGTGGAIRLRAETVSLLAGSMIVGRGGIHGQFCGCNTDVARGGNGRVRIEASSITNLGTINGSQSFPGAPSPLFAATPLQLYVTAVCGQSAPADPEWGIYTKDIDLNSASACTVNIEGSGMPVGTIVVVRAIPARGNIISVNSTPMVDAGGGLRTATASVTFPAGRAELQLRANW